MAKHNNSEISVETQEEALVIAKKTQKPGQTKEQTRLIAQGIQKGIAEYKKVAKSKLRQADKAKKKIRKPQQPVAETATTTEVKSADRTPWVLLALSWIGFAAYVFYNQ